MTSDHAQPYELKPFQIKRINLLVPCSRVVLGSETGLGKTIQSIISVRRVALARTGVAYPTKKQTHIHVVAPTIAQGVWIDEIKLFYPEDTIAVFKGIKGVTEVIDSGSKIAWVIFTFDGYRKYVMGKTPLKIYSPTGFIVDEAHELRDPASLITQACTSKIAPAQNSVVVQFLTATPFPNNVANSYPMFNFCMPNQLGSYMDFARQYAHIQDKTKWGKPRIYGCRRRRLPELVERVRPVLHRDFADENLPELPDYKEIDIRLQETKKVREISMKLEVYREAVKIAIVSNKRPPKDLKFETLRRELALEKISQGVKFVENLLSQNEAVAIYVYHTDVAKAVCREIPGSEMIIGETPKALRREIIARFQNGTTKCLVLSVRAGGQSITLTAGRIGVWLEIDYQPMWLEQNRGRFRRIGQKRFCLYYYLFFPDSYDSDIFDTVKEKSKDSAKFWALYRKENPDLDDDSDDGLSSDGLGGEAETV